MADAIIATIVSADLKPPIYATYLAAFQKEVRAFDYAFYEKHGEKRVLPNHQFGDTSDGQDTGGDAARASGLYDAFLDGFRITGYDSQAYVMNWGFRLDDMGNGAQPFTPTDLYAEIDYNFTDCEIPEGTAYGNAGTGATNYRIHDKALVNKFFINVPIVFFGATTQFDTYANILMATEDNVQLMKAFGEMAQMVQTQYIRATLINEATQLTPIDLSATGTVEEIEAAMKVVKNQFNKRRAKKYTTSIAATDRVGTQSVRSSFLGVINSQMQDTVDLIPGFVHIDEYSNSSPTMPNEYGHVKKAEFRLITNDILVRQSETAGGRVLGIADKVENGELTEFNMLLMAKDAYTIASLKGADRYKIYIQKPGTGGDVLHREKNCGWTVTMGAKVHRRAYLYNLKIKLA